MRIFRTLLVITLALVIVAGAALVLFLRPAAVYACPACFGLKGIGDNVFVEAEASEEDIAELKARLARARTTVEAFYGTLTTSPVLLVCQSEACDDRVGATDARAQAFGDVFIIISAQGWEETILAHELAHIELHGRIGDAALMRGALPAWFDEGLAVLISKDPRYLEMTDPSAPQCLEPAADDLPVSNAEWGRRAGQGDQPIYAMAACRTLGWIDSHGGRPGVDQLIETLRNGGTFTE